MRESSVFLENYQHLPEPGWLSCGFSVLRAGKVEAATGYAIRRPSYPGQDLLYCLAGHGTIESGGRRITVGAGRLVWIANELPHAHWAREDDPWTLLWLRLDGPDIVACRERLFAGQTASIALPRALAEPWFERVFELLRRRSRDADLELNRQVGELLVMLGPARRERGGGTGPPEALETLLEAIRAAPERAWDARAMCAVANISPEQLRRWFRRHLQTSPHRWLMRERLMKARELLLNGDLSITATAEACGYCDVYHFSREFRRAVGTSPSAWRRSEAGL